MISADRPYQARAIAAARNAIVRDGKRSVLLVSPTGSGKTVMLTDICAGHLARGGSIVWTAHRTELITQAAQTLEAAGLIVGYRGLKPSASIQVESIQTILSRGTAPSGTMYVIDEAHHYVADEWKALPNLASQSGALIIGATATPERKDGQGLGLHHGGIFDHMIVVAQIRDLVDLGFLVPSKVLAPRIARQGTTMEVSPITAYERHAPDSSAVVFAPHVKAAHEFASAFNARGHPAKVITGKTPYDLRASILYEFKTGALRVLVNVHVLTEGWDAPIASTCILARRFGSASAYLQAVGRVLRPHPGKTGALVLDLYGCNVEEFGAPDAERIFSLDGRGIKTSSGLAFCKVHGIPIPCNECDRIPSEQVTPDDADGQLDPWAAFREAHQTADRRTKFLAALIRTQRAKGYKFGWVAMLYKTKMRSFPPHSLIEAAKAMIDGEFAIGERDSRN